ncbi:MAG: phosphatase PAP2 family protein [Scytonema hyalinum WJT4-NPBG1]|jgi:hypothetical protein|nr:phosphatase PAP2 family protein [Scytonema hyalinum WJT4-NPBG1]
MDSVLFWNEVALQAVASDHSGSPAPGQQGGPTFTSRALAIVHAAIYDTSNSFTRTHKPYHTIEDIPKGSSVESAITGAAMATLMALYSQQSDFLNESLEKFRQQVGSIDQSSFDLGQRIGLAIFESRRDDGSDENRPPSGGGGGESVFLNTISTPANGSGVTPGMHAPDPLNPNQGLYAPTWGNVRPFAIQNIHDLRAPAPPALDSQEYRDAFDEVKSKGAIQGTARSPEETYIGLFWAYDGANLIGTPPRLYNQLARVIAQSQGFSQKENARYFALLNLAMADAGIQCWDTKYFYNLWRPIVGIRNEMDANRKVPKWQPLGSPRSNNPPGSETRGLDFTPPFPAYTSGHATFGTASMTVIKLFLEEQGYDPDMEIEDFVSDELNGETTDTNGDPRPRVPMTFILNKAIQDNLESRVFLGVHWRFDGTVGARSGEQIAQEVFRMVATPA